MLRLDKEVRRRGELLSYETRYFLSGLDPDAVPASTFQELILRHWKVENCLHLQKDRYFEEDKHVLRGGNLGEAWTLREVHEKYLADPRPTAKRLGLKNKIC